MSLIGNFSRPDAAPGYFIDFLNLIDNHPPIRASIPNPNSARELPALARQARLKNLAIHTESDDWLGEQAALNAKGDFFQAWLFVCVTGSI